LLFFAAQYRKSTPNTRLDNSKPQCHPSPG
jgi:hypothetical protein